MDDQARTAWPVPEHVRGASARDAFLWYICQAWPLFFGGNGNVETVLDHDSGYHVARYQGWELRLVNLEEFPDE